MCQWHEQHRCLALDPCHKQNKPRGPAVPRPLTVLLLHVERGWAPASSPRTSRCHLLVEQEESRAAWSAFVAHGAATNTSLRRYCGGDGAQTVELTLSRLDL